MPLNRIYDMTRFALTPRHTLKPRHTYISLCNMIESFAWTIHRETVCRLRWQPVSYVSPKNINIPTSNSLTIIRIISWDIRLRLPVWCVICTLFSNQFCIKSIEYWIFYQKQVYFRERCVFLIGALFWISITCLFLK